MPRFLQALATLVAASATAAQALSLVQWRAAVHQAEQLGHEATPRAKAKAGAKQANNAARSVAQKQRKAVIQEKTGDLSLRHRSLLDRGWKFKYEKVEKQECGEKQFSVQLRHHRCSGLQLQAQVMNEFDCRDTCCNDPECEVFQFCPQDSAHCTVPPLTCWTGKRDEGSCKTGGYGMIAYARPASLLQEAASKSVPIIKGGKCTEDRCQPEFDDSTWRAVNLPHDFVILGNASEGNKKINGYLPGGKGWYRLNFEVPAAAKAGSIWLDFDGVQRNSAVYLNGHFLGQHFSGYTPFRYDIAKFAHFGAPNVLAVMVDATWPVGWWYDGGGIYRHVWLNMANKVHVAPWGVYLPAKVTGPICKNVADALVTAETEVVNALDKEVDIEVWTELQDPQGDAVGIEFAVLILKAKQNGTTSAQIPLKNAQLWSDRKPQLYTSVTTVKIDGKVVDTVTDAFGIRKMVWDSEQGFILNDQPTKIKGFANHQDFAGVGVAVPDSLQAYRVYMHKQMGSNAWRTAHNPPTTALLDEADKQGLLVWDENHRNRDSPDMLQDLTTLIKRDRNHPSVFMWSLCNEALCEKFDAGTAAKLSAVVKTLDPEGQRPVTAGVNYVREHNDPFHAALDVVGINYQINQYDEFHGRHPGQPIIASETSSDTADRGIYATKGKKAMFLSNGADSFPPWGATAEDAWCNVANRSFVSGAFYWTGFDYRGEPTPNSWPNVLSHFGIMDNAGFKKDKFFYHQSVFFSADEQPILHVLPHWNWDDKHGLPCEGFCKISELGQKYIEVWAYSNGDAVELFLNGKSLGRQTVIPCRHVQWSVPYEVGELRAVSYRGGSSEVLAEESLHTTGHPTAVALETEWPSSGAPLKADGSDTAIVTVRLHDDAGHLVSTASAPVAYTLTGPGKIIGMGNGNPVSHEHDDPMTPTFGRRDAWMGLARIIVQATDEPGEIRLKAESEGLASGELVITTRIN